MGQCELSDRGDIKSLDLTCDMGTHIKAPWTVPLIHINANLVERPVRMMRLCQ